MVGISGFGFALIDLYSAKLLQMISFETIYVKNAQNYNITQIIQLGNRGIRVLLNDEGSFSLIWKSINDLDSQMPILVDLVLADRFQSIKNEISTRLVETNELGFVQIVYYQNSIDYYDAYLRVYNAFNHKLSKSFRELKIGQVKECESLRTRVSKENKKIDIVVVCGFQLYVYSIELYPFMYIKNTGLNSTVEISLISSNQNSQQDALVKLSKNEVSSSFSKWWQLLILLILIIFTWVACNAIFNKIEAGKKEKKVKLNSTKGTFISKSSTAIESTYSKRKLDKYESRLEVLTEDIKEDYDSDFSEEGTFAKSMRAGTFKNHMDGLTQDNHEDHEMHESIRQTFSRSSRGLNTFKQDFSDEDEEPDNL